MKKLKFLTALIVIFGVSISAIVTQRFTNGTYRAEGKHKMIVRRIYEITWNVRAASEKECERLIENEFLKIKDEEFQKSFGTIITPIPGEPMRIYMDIYNIDQGNYRVRVRTQISLGINKTLSKPAIEDRTKKLEKILSHHLPDNITLSSILEDKIGA